MEKYLTLEQYEKLKEAKSAEEVILVAKEAGVELTTEQAEAILARFHELSDEDLADVAGGYLTLGTWDFGCMDLSLDPHCATNLDERGLSWYYLMQGGDPCAKPPEML